MSANTEKESPAIAWASLLFGLAAAGLTVSLLIDAATWWQFATMSVSAALSISLIVVGIRGLVLQQRQRRSALDAVEAEVLERR
ncbi:hypothetical protein ESZ53_12350 [Salinibacterium sp. UTAS2018]|uniref:hypothetical protein n=1 Tax=Salinibacterium sp. UTAS2018 TaxID=2508880 RepID=UPI0010097BE6|nr:hypothetical protein [Salinibacterium sp. UTAS2018]QAV71162.1 hypothetical protein ESZ53_12350 [Salinibacterium sp. UTAS2018]